VFFHMKSVGGGQKCLCMFFELPTKFLIDLHSLFLFFRLLIKFFVTFSKLTPYRGQVHISAMVRGQFTKMSLNN